MASTQVEDEVKRAREIAEAGRTHRDELVRRTAAKHREIKLRDAPDEDALQALVGMYVGLLDRRGEQLTVADDALAAELGDDAKYLAERDRLRVELRDELVEIRDNVRTICGPVAVAAAGFVGDTPEDDAGLVRLGRAVFTNLRADPPKSKSRKSKFNAVEATEGLDDRATNLEKAAAAVRREKREEQGTRATRDSAWAEFERQMRATALGLEALFRQAGMDDLADRLVPSRRAPPSGGAKEEPPTPPNPS